MDATLSPLPLQFFRADGTLFEISVAAWSAMQHYIQYSIDATEAGGVLLGRHLRDRSAIILDAVTTPQPGDRRSRPNFIEHGDIIKPRSMRHGGRVMGRVPILASGTRTLSRSPRHRALIGSIGDGVYAKTTTPSRSSSSLSAS